LETGSEEVDLKEEVKFEVVSNVCAGDRGLFCVCGINGGGGGGGGGIITFGIKKIQKITLKDKHTLIFLGKKEKNKIKKLFIIRNSAM